MLPLKVGISSLGSFTILVSVDGFETGMTADVVGFTIFLRMLRPMSNSNLSMSTTIDFMSVSDSVGVHSLRTYCRMLDSSLLYSATCS